MQRGGGKSSNVQVKVRVGDPKLDNTNFIERESWSMLMGDRGGGLVARSAQFADVREVAERWTTTPLVARRTGRYYYTVVLDVETLSLSDLDELERWLKGELQPAVLNPVKTGNALTRGLRTLVARLLGGERVQYQARSGKFEVR